MAVIVPYLIGISSNELGRPLNLLQAESGNEAGTKGLVSSLNTALRTAALSPSSVDSNFIKHWPDLEAVIKQNSIPATLEHKFEPFPWIVSLRDATQWLKEIVNKIGTESRPQYADIVNMITDL